MGQLNAPFSKMRPFPKKNVSLPIFYVLQKKHVIAAIFGAFKILGQIHQIEPLLGSSSYLDILLFACHIGVGNLGLGQNLCAQQDAWK
jgi:hypothetical protein